MNLAILVLIVVVFAVCIRTYWKNTSLWYPLGNNFFYLPFVAALIYAFPTVVWGMLRLLKKIMSEKIVVSGDTIEVHNPKDNLVQKVRTQDIPYFFKGENFPIGGGAYKFATAHAVFGFDLFISNVTDLETILADLTKKSTNSVPHLNYTPPISNYRFTPLRIQLPRFALVMGQAIPCLFLVVQPPLVGLTSLIVSTFICQYLFKDYSSPSIHIEENHIRQCDPKGTTMVLAQLSEIMVIEEESRPWFKLPNQTDFTIHTEKGPIRVAHNIAQKEQLREEISKLITGRSYHDPAPTHENKAAFIQASDI